MTRIRLGRGAIYGSFIPALDGGSARFSAIRVSTGDTGPRVELWLGDLQPPPFSDEAARKELLARIDRIPNVANGLALCSLHHMAFDPGALSADDGLRILVSQDVHGESQMEALRLRSVGQPLRRPRAAHPLPSPSSCGASQGGLSRAGAGPA